MRGRYCQSLPQVPDLAALATAEPVHFPFLLDNAAQGVQGGFSLLLFSSGETLVQHADGKLEGPGTGDNFFDRLETWYQSERMPAESGLNQTISPVAKESKPDEIQWPFFGGWFLFLGYEMAALVEPSLRLPTNGSGLPDAIAARCKGAVIVHHPGQDASTHSECAVAIAENEQDLRGILAALKATAAPRVSVVPPLISLEDENPDKFKQGVDRVLHYLRCGDVFQVNISRHWQGHFAQLPAAGDVYRQLRCNNPAPFAGMMQWGDHSLLSSSPERLVEVKGRQVQTRPIAGTRRRGQNADQDMALSRELIDNVKERAEHIMLIDLERNDMGRVCKPGSIRVSELMVIESYAHVHHIVSNIKGELTPQASPIDALKAVFPGGTITGCPKVRCMEIIAELEQEGRGFYTGSMGYLGVDGNMDLNILIRSMLLHQDSVFFRTGAGIVADSQAERELEETREKARGMLLALEADKEVYAHA